MGSDADYIYFVTPSWSRPDLEHDISICKRTGDVFCSCEDAVCRKKRPNIFDLFDGTGEACKHARGLAIAYRRYLQGE